MGAPAKPYNEKKATQVAARLLKRAGGSYDYLLLIKLLYMVERSSLIDRARPVMEDELFSLPHGPAVSRAMDLTTGNLWGSTGFWAGHISKDSDSHLVSLTDDPGEDELSESEAALIDRVWNEFGTMNPRELYRYMHNLPEWKDPGSSRLRISVEEVLAQRHSPEMVAAITEDMEMIRKAHAFFQSI